MTFELKTNTEAEEYIEESITTEHTTIKLWNPSQLESRIAEIDAEILTLQERKSLLQEQLPKFTKEISKE